MNNEKKIEEIKKIIDIYIETGERKVYILGVKEVAEITGKSIPAIYSSRRNGTNINDLKAIHEKIKKIIEE